MSEISENEIKILNVISEEKNTSQRKISNNIGISLGMVNIFIKKLTTKGLVKIKKTTNKKSLKYLLTSKGFSERVKFNLYYFKKNLEYFSNAKKELISKLDGLEKNGIEQIYIFGTDEWSEIIYLAAQNFNFKILAFLTLNKNNDEKKFGYPIENIKSINEFNNSYILTNLEEKNNLIDLSDIFEKNFIFF